MSQIPQPQDLSKYTQEVTNNNFVLGNYYKATPMATAPGLQEQFVKCTTNEPDRNDNSKQIIKFHPDAPIEQYYFFEEPTTMGKLESMFGLRGGKSKTRKSKGGKKSKARKLKAGKSKSRKSRRM